MYSFNICAVNSPESMRLRVLLPKCLSYVLFWGIEGLKEVNRFGFVFSFQGCSCVGSGRWLSRSKQMKFHTPFLAACLENVFTLLIAGGFPWDRPGWNINGVSFLITYLPHVRMTLITRRGWGSPNLLLPQIPSPNPQPKTPSPSHTYTYPGWGIWGVGGGAWQTLLLFHHFLGSPLLSCSYFWRGFHPLYLTLVTSSKSTHFPRWWTG